jgi:hypothetical protein
MKHPQYLIDGWRRNGPAHCLCPMCGQSVTTNALGRASHARTCTKAMRKVEHYEAIAKGTAPAGA